NGNGVAGFYVARFAFDANPSRAVRNVIYFLGLDVIMFLRARAGRQTRFRQALVADDGIAMRQQFTDFRTVLGEKRCKIVEILNIHGIFGFWAALGVRLMPVPNLATRKTLPKCDSRPNLKTDVRFVACSGKI